MIPASPPRLDPAAVRRTLRTAGLRPRHRLSQNFLADVDVLEAILAEASPAPGRTVLEIGPGLGILTGGLLAAGAAVTAVELDAGLVRHLGVAFAGELEAGAAAPLPQAGPPGSLRIIEGDILDQDLGALVARPYDVVANLPYHVTSPVLHLLLGGEPRPARAVLMLQREVAERVAAPPGAMSYLSVFVQYHADARLIRRVPREAFEPAPAVESAVLALDTRAPEAAARLDPAAEDDLWRLVQAGFRERRKMLRNVLTRQLPLEPGRLDAALAATGIAGDRRPQALGVGEWLALAAALGPLPADRRGRKAEPVR
ncbi:MAG: 16S rRNA (adenine(1518)-N(6)/adenine(1519)-N(6))-dimethyltransferase RsmA [Chloroflexi bacterium]|nr:16S rRNA (adenine(1518)-N(6)/adenine(1519)-N(6))-dimethyltransferase RsmA [Chloroflexota bacterium]